MNNKEPRNVYILTNPNFREDWVKIGKSSSPIEVKNQQPVPLIFAVIGATCCPNWERAKKVLINTSFLEPCVKEKINLSL